MDVCLSRLPVSRLPTVPMRLLKLHFVCAGYLRSQTTSTSTAPPTWTRAVFLLGVYVCHCHCMLTVHQQYVGSWWVCNIIGCVRPVGRMKLLSTALFEASEGATGLTFALPSLARKLHICTRYSGFFPEREVWLHISYSLFRPSSTGI